MIIKFMYFLSFVLFRINNSNVVKKPICKPDTAKRWAMPEIEKSSRMPLLTYVLSPNKLA